MRVSTKTRKTADRRRKKAALRRSKKRADRIRPAYEPDDGPLTAKQIAAIKKLVPQGRGMVVTSSLFPDELTQASRRKQRGSRGAKTGGKGWDAFQAMLDRPARRKPKLVRLLKTKAPWD